MAVAAQPQCDRAAALAATPRPAAHPWLVLATCVLASSLAFVDGSVVNVALPAIGASLKADAAALQWVVNAYLLPLSALLLLGGAAGDRYGRRRLLVVGTALFGAASLACAAAPTLGWLLAARFLQGAAAALLMPNSLAILGASFAGAARGRAIGIWAAAGAGAGALGPVLGGALIDFGDWRAIFLINLPIAAGAVLLAWRFVPADADPGGDGLDWPGGSLATLGLGALTYGLTLGSGAAGWHPAALASVAGGVVALLLFLVTEHRRGEAAMLPLSLFASPGFVGLSLFTGLLYGALGALMVVLPWLLIARGYSGTAAGAALLPFPLVLSLTSPLMGGLAGRIGPRWPLVLGPLVVAVGFALALRVTTGDYWREVLPMMLVIAIGMSGAVAPLTTAVLSSVDPRRTGSASGFNSAVARTGGLVATALLGGVLGAEGAALLAAFHLTMLVGAAACLAASACAFLWVGRR